MVYITCAVVVQVISKTIMRFVGSSYQTVTRCRYAKGNSSVRGPEKMHVAIKQVCKLLYIRILTRICLAVEYTVGFSKNCVQNESIELYSLDKLLIISIQCILFKFST